MNDLNTNKLSTLHLSGLFIGNNGKVRFWPNIQFHNKYIDKIINTTSYVVSSLKLMVNKLNINKN